MEDNMVVWLSLSVTSLIIVSVSGCVITDNNRHCLYNKCKYVNGNPLCTDGCVDGRTGTFCQEICRDRCLACESNDPYTCTICDVGRYGKTCEHTCDTCINKRCHLNGTCVEGCVHPSWGDMCDKVCSSHCSDAACDNVTGECLYGCKDGFRGAKCQEPPVLCPDGSNGPNCTETCPETCTQCQPAGSSICTKCATGFYGVNCSEICSHGCKGTLCRPDGRCLEGCADGYTGELCDMMVYSATDPKPTQAQSQSNTENNSWGNIMTFVQNNDLFFPFLGCAVVLCITATGLIVWRCSKKKRRQIPHRDDSQCSFIRQEETEYSPFRQCGDTYHEIADEDLEPDPVRDWRPLPPSSRPRLPRPESAVNIHGLGLPGADYMTPLPDFSTGDESRVTTSTLCSTYIPQLGFSGGFQGNSSHGDTSSSDRVLGKREISMNACDTHMTVGDHSNINPLDTSLYDTGYLTTVQTGHGETTVSLFPGGQSEITGQSRQSGMSDRGEQSEMSDLRTACQEQKVLNKPPPGQDTALTLSRNIQICNKPCRLSCEF